MDKEFLIVVGTLLVVLALFSVCSAGVHSNDAIRTVLNVSSEGPLKLSVVTGDIKTSKFYKGYDNETLDWMESLGDKYVFHSSDEIVIMNRADADKIPSMYVCDADFTESFSCNVLENRSLGGNNSKDVLLIENVEYIGESVHYWDV